MEYAKKMILVDPRIIEKLTSAKDEVLNNIENEMDTVLNSDMPDDEKAKLYAASAKRHIIINTTDKETEVQPDTCQSYNTAAVLNDIVTSMPTPHIRRAMKFAKFIKDNQINFNERGELVHNQNVSENSNATDLINEVLRRKQMNTTGSKEFATLLNELNCPIELIGNPSYRKYMQSGHGITVNRSKKRSQRGRGVGIEPKKSNKRKLRKSAQSETNSRKKSNKKNIQPRFKWCKY